MSVEAFADDVFLLNELEGIGSDDDFAEVGDDMEALGDPEEDNDVSDFDDHE